ncbi:transposase [Paraburkholderia phenazinium]|uniref:Transposase n=1 Tax=Paraburkholderia phenazinium TaxID=60549 RepID=A0A1G7UFK8_9BURK|nr:transposase [Paraburkholderia phenazinium]SDG46352.1 Transposase [Paraburkholderia phenazinium]
MFFDELSNDEWALLAALVSDEPAVRLNRRGRPRAEPRIVANAVLWILTTGEPWSKLPGRYPSGPTCRRRFEEWQLNGTLAEMTRLLSQTGRTFVYVPQTTPPAPAKPAAQPETVSARDDSMRGVSWKSPESWQTPAGVMQGWRSLDPLADMTRQLSGTLPHDAVRTEPAVRRAAELGNVQPLHCDHPQRPLPVSYSARGMQIADRRGYVIYVAAERVPNAMYRAWAEIEKDGRRVERSGLVGPRFTDANAAQDYALEWARQWIDRACRTVSAATHTAHHAAHQAATAHGYTRPLQPARSMPGAPTVSSAGVRADAPANAAAHAPLAGHATGHGGGHGAAQVSSQLAAHPNGALTGGPVNAHSHGALHGPIGALRAPLRRYPGDAAAESTVERASDRAAERSERSPFPPELISHAG